MKIRLRSTKLVDEKKNPITFFHVTPCEKIESFLPLSHFGTQTAARMRSMHFMYKTIGLPEPAAVPTEILRNILEKFQKLSDKPNLHMHVVYLAMKSPLRIPDLAHHSLEQYFKWFSNKYVPKSQFLTGQERCEGDVVTPSRIKYKRILSDYIFRNPFIQSEENLKKELSTETFYSISDPEEKAKFIPSFLPSIASKMDAKVYSLAEKVAFQRMMRYLEGEGYDGFVYQNEYEDKGKNSYIIFRPEQVFDTSEKIVEHILPEKTLEEKSFLYSLESNFFESQKTISPSQRIQNHLQKLKKSRVR